MPGVSVSVNAVLSQLEREPGEIVVDQRVVERATLVAEQRGRVIAAAHLLAGTAPVAAGRRRPARRGRDPLAARARRTRPFWPDASAAGLAVAEAAVGTAEGLATASIGADGTRAGARRVRHARAVATRRRPAPAGRVQPRRAHRDRALLADVAELPRPAAAARPAGGADARHGRHEAGRGPGRLRVGLRRGRHRHRRVRRDRRPARLGRRRQSVGAGGRPGPRGGDLAARRGRRVAAARPGRPAAGLRRSRRDRLGLPRAIRVPAAHRDRAGLGPAGA